MGLLDCTSLVIVLLMTLCLTVTPSGGQTNNTLSSDGTIVWGKLAPDKPYQTATYQAADGGLDPYYNLARSFIDSSLPEYLPLEETKDLLDGKTSIGTAWQGLVLKFIGFIICLAIGFLFIIIFPIVCCCFCCCRCCGNCGGKRLQKKDKRANCKRTVFSVCLFVLSAFVITGAACVFVTSDQFHKNLKGLNQSVNESASDIDTFIENLQSQFNRIGDENFKFLAGVLNTYVTGASTDVSERLIDKISNAVNLAQPLNTLSDLSNKAKQTTTQLSDKVTILKNQRDDAVTTIQSDCPSNCNSEITSLNTMNITALETKVNNFKDQVSTDVFGAMKNDIDVKIKREIENATKGINVTSQLDGIYNDQIKPLLSKIDDLQKSANDMASSMTAVVKDGVKLVEQYDIYRWYAGIGLASLILLMALFALTGLLLGCCCGSAKTKPTERSSASNCGGICLMSSVGFIFIFGALLMLLCTLMYVFGSMTERYGCQSFKDLSKVEKYTSSLNLGLNLHNVSFSVMNSTISLGASRLMDGCKQGQTLYSVLGLSSIINSSLAKIEDYKKNLNISGNINASQVANSVGGGVNVSSEIAQLQETVNATNDLKTAITAMKTTVTTIKSNLISKSPGGPAKLDAMITTLSEMETITDTLTADSTNIVNEANKLPALINDATNKLNDATFMTSLVSNVTQEFIDKIFSFVDSYIANIISMLATDVGKCTPVYSISNAIFGEAICHGLVDPLNGFWLALGWSIFFLMPSLIFSVKLAKYFRRMLYDDGYDTKAPSAPPGYSELSMTQTSKQSVFPPVNGTNKVAPF